MDSGMTDERENLKDNPESPVALKDRIAALEAENAELRKDAERINWLQRQDFDDIYFTIFHDHPNNGMYGVSIGAGWGIGKTFREALDAAMKEAQS